MRVSPVLVLTVLVLGVVKAHGQGLFDFGGEAVSQFNRGKAAQDAGNLKQAVTWYKKTIATDDRYFRAYNNLGYIYGGKGYHVQAIEWYKKALLANPRFVEGYSNLGATYMELGKPEVAVKILEQAV